MSLCMYFEVVAVAFGELEFPHYFVAHSEEVICHMKKL